MLYIVATPIGNLGEMSRRALDVLNAVDFVAAEDTRRTGLLLNAFGIKKPLIGYRKHNERAVSEQIADRLGIGLTTVISHRRNIMEKLGIRSVAGLVVYALAAGYADPDGM